MYEFILTGFADEINRDFDVQLNEINGMGIDYIEIRSVDGKSIVAYSLDEIKAIKEKLDAANVKISAVGSPIGKIKITDDFEPHFELFKHTVEIAKLLGTNYIRLFSFFVEEGTADSHRDEVMRRMLALKDYVEGTDIILLHENEKDIYGDTAERCLDIYKTLNSDNVKLIFDPANFVQCQVETYPHAFNMLKDHVIYYHVKDAIKSSGEVVPSGYGDGHLPEIIKELKDRSYKGFLSLEPHLGMFDGFAALEGEGVSPVFEEKSDAGKFKLAVSCLKSIIEEV